MLLHVHKILVKYELKNNYVHLVIKLAGDIFLLDSVNSVEYAFLAIVKDELFRRTF